MPATFAPVEARLGCTTAACLPKFNPDPNARRIVAYGLRNPFRFTFRPGTNEIWIGDVLVAQGDGSGALACPTVRTARSIKFAADAAGPASLAPAGSSPAR